MRTHVPGFLSFSAFLHHFFLAKLVIKIIRVAAGGYFGQYKMMKNSEEGMTETLAHGTHLRVPIESFPMNTNMKWFRWFSKIFAFLCFG